MHWYGVCVGSSAYAKAEAGIRSYTEATMYGAPPEVCRRMYGVVSRVHATPKPRCSELRQRFAAGVIVQRSFACAGSYIRRRYFRSVLNHNLLRRIQLLIDIIILYSSVFCTIFRIQSILLAREAQGRTSTAYVCVCVYVCMCVYVCVHTHTHKYTHTHIRTHTLYSSSPGPPARAKWIGSEK